MESKCKQNYRATRDEFIKGREKEVDWQQMQNYRCNHDKFKKKDKGTSSKHKLSYRANFLTLD